MVSAPGTIDYMFAQLSLSSDYSWASIIAGFIIVAIIIFLAIKVFGENKQDIGAFGIMLIAFIATVLVTAIGLFPWYILIIYLVGGLVFILYDKMLSVK
jgi:chromate transport protein ChrA